MEFQGKKLYEDSFNAFAENYDDARPGYPTGLFKDLKDVCNITDMSKILEIGAGSGIATKELVNYGVPVVALEPGENLYKIAKAKVANPLVEFRNLTFEDYADQKLGEKFSLIAAFTSFHWLKREDVFEQLDTLLAENGTIAVVWNTFLQDTSQVSEEVENVYQEQLSDVYPGKTDLDAVNKKSLGKLDGRIAKLTGREDFRVEFQKTYACTYEYNAKTYPEFLGTFPKIIELPTERKERFLQRVSEVIGNRAMTVPVVTSLIVLRRKADFLSM